MTSTTPSALNDKSSSSLIEFQSGNGGEALECVGQEFEKLLKRQSKTAKATVSALDNLLSKVNSLVDVHNNNNNNNSNTDNISINSVYQSEIKKLAKEVSTSHKDLYGMISKFGKTVDKNFRQDLDQAANPNTFIGKSNDIIRCIVEHFHRVNERDIADAVVKESQIEWNSDRADIYFELSFLQDAINQRNLKPAIEWCVRNSLQLKRMKSDLEFKLIRLEYLQLLETKSRKTCLEYAQNTLPRFCDNYLSSVKPLMGALVYHNNVQNSPYALYYSDLLWDEAKMTMRNNFCVLMKIPFQCPIYTTVAVGHVALPRLLKMKSVFTDKHENRWSEQNEIPMDIELSSKYQYHSVFVCPVSKETTAKDNPPMRLPCGHVIAKMSLLRISKNTRFKCPYCPSEQLPSDAFQIHF